MTFIPIMVPLLLAMPVGPILKWKRDDPGSALRRLRLAAYASLLIAIITLVITFGNRVLTMLAVTFFMALAAWLVFGSLAVLAHRMRIGTAPLTTSLRLARTTPLAFYGLILAHSGMGVTVAGITGMTTFATEKIEMLRPGQSLELSGYEVRLRSVGNLAGPNYEVERAVFDISRKGRPFSQLSSERRFYPVRQQQTTAAGIRTNLISNLYVTLGEPDGKGSWAVRFYYHPFMPWVWLGALTMALGGFVSLSDRRLRVGAPQRSVQALAAVPAE
jgi:cytochrome c-type biogenesis protein CcmF